VRGLDLVGFWGMFICVASFPVAVVALVLIQMGVVDAWLGGGIAIAALVLFRAEHVVLTRRRNKFLALQATASAFGGATTNTDPLVRRRAERELSAYKRVWAGFASAMVVASLLLLMLPFSERVFVFGNLDQDSVSVFLIAYAFSVAATATFCRYPSASKVREKIGMWRDDPASLAPAFVAGRAVGPNTAFHALFAGAMAVWLSGFTTFMALATYVIVESRMALFFYCYPPVLFAIVGLVIQRRHATKAAESALGK
jgi:hypothetical protein